MSDFSAGESGRETELALDGSLTIENASAIRKKLISTLIREDRLWSALTRMSRWTCLYCSFSVQPIVQPQISVNLSRSASSSVYFPAAVENASIQPQKGVRP